MAATSLIVACGGPNSSGASLDLQPTKDPLVDNLFIANIPDRESFLPIQRDPANIPNGKIG